MADLRKLLTVAALLVAPACAQQQPPDPANLTYEHVAPQALADTLPINRGAPALQQLLVKLRTRASMMMIVAHPDDEDGGFLTYESRGQGARVAMLTLTRGEGGQNLMSADFDDALGLIRTQELLAADRYEGVDQYFGTEVDFGFSKTKEESFQKWTHDRVLYDAVRCVRLYRPLVLASVFVGGPTDGHGHHQVAGEIAQEVFLAAADPKVFPEMGLPPWAPLKVYARVPFSRVTGDTMFDYATGKSVPTLFHNYVTGQDSRQAPVATVQIHEGEKSTLIGMAGDSYIQFARKGLALQKTQIGGGAARLAPSGEFNVGYTLMATRLGCSNQRAEGTPSLPARVSQGSTTNGALAPGVCSPATAESSIFEGIDTSLPGIADLAPSMPATLRILLGKIDQQVAEAQRLFDPAKPELTAPPLRESLRALDSLLKELEDPNIDDLPIQEKFNLLHELRIKRVQLNNALVLADGVMVESTLEPSLQNIPNPIFPTEVTFPGNVPSDSQAVIITRLDFGKSDQGSHAQSRVVVSEKPVERIRGFLVPSQPNRPYFSRPNSEQPFYDIADPSLRNAPETPPGRVTTSQIEDDGVQIEAKAIVAGVHLPSSRQSSLQPFSIVPPISVAISPAAGIVRLGTQSLNLAVLAVGPDSESISLKGPVGWQISAGMTETMSRNQAKQFTVIPDKVEAGKLYQFTGVAAYDHHEYHESYRPVGYPGLTYTNYYTPAIYRATAVDVTTAPNLHIAFLPGTGDAVPDFLPNLGVTPTILTLKELTPEILSKYDAVILGVRAYAAHPELAGPGSKPLLDYAAGGGIVILEYMTARYGDAEAPYPIAVSGDSAHNVVVEAEPVQLLAPANPLLTWPNKITSADFNNWVEERGHGFAASWSPEYTPLLETHDPDQDPQKGGMLLAKVGKGAYIYCALALYRQLPEGVPGAYRLMANLLSYAKNPNR